MYESQSDRDAEESIIQYACTKWKSHYHKLPISYNLDYAIIQDGQIKAYIETKRRHNNHDKYPTIFVSMHKVMTARQLLLPSYFLVGWNDRIGYVSLTDKPDIQTIGGRTDRNDSADIEPMAHFNINRIKLI